MKHLAKSIRPFIGAIDFEESRSFYKDFGFEEFVISKGLSFFRIKEDLGFYLQNAYVKDWLENTMLFLEVDDVDEYWKQLQILGLDQKYENVQLSPIKDNYWGRECFMHDPSGVLWHFGEFKKAAKE